ncbi:MAG: Gfo/Idh/MocA family oxidoreductase [Bacteroidetes bacterium]|nr:Gfo/Idh/MocA family oxidoreductase [Bacteroidota bacterium]
MKKEKIRFAIIGLGNIGVRHAKHIEAHPDAHLVSVCDIRPEALSFFEPSKVQLFDNLDEMLLKAT